ncbi:hypothetical protein GN244_ATG15550 [Phytophthora infestans]|uniref:WRKY19-like zinc finger domain-containing protein n=1 Tax=Phytophthora infestans TaxID=4787 RepID=A0A833SFD3_PHYIN|nr:hypothetical protein GN244_ATG15550 [Phytophthora infestans]KAF4142373.1 hypothetical protein GN958_ATG08549 [Phytophthora infestans]KAI9980705.1 hypothetical protein PInf_010024 [Phytophthora infestans]
MAVRAAKAFSQALRILSFPDLKRSHKQAITFENQFTRAAITKLLVMFREKENKSALAFILNPSSLPSTSPHTPSHGCSSASVSPVMSPLSKADMGMADSDDSNESDINEDEARIFDLHIGGRSLLSDNAIVEKCVEQLLAISDNHDEMRVCKSSICAQDECPRAAVSRGRCVRHGGGSRCSFPNCTHGARLYNRCFHHGGCKLCKISGCTSKAKRYGYCWSHGGGHICDAPGCSKVAAPGGFCWAHGGGNRCKVDGCNRRSYQKHNYFCMQHHAAQGGKTP